MSNDVTTSFNTSDEIAYLKARVTQLEALLTEHNIPFENIEQSVVPMPDPYAIVNEFSNVVITDSPAGIAEMTSLLKVRPAPTSPYITHHTLTPSEIHRFGRHLILPEVGAARQEKWLKSSVLVVGAGGLGAPVCLYLAAAGVGHITVIDDDDVDVTNLQRQVIHSEATLGYPKALSAARAMAQINSQLCVVPIVGRFSEHNALALCRAHDVVIDASDNVFTRYLINDAAVIAGKPVVSGSALRTEGQLVIYGLPHGPCYRCLYPSPPPAATVTNCSDGGVLGVVPGVIGTLQALEALKYLAGAPADELLAQRLLVFDAGACVMRTVKLRGRSDTCAVCGVCPSITAESLSAYQQLCSAAQHDKASAGSAQAVYAGADGDAAERLAQKATAANARVVTGAISCADYVTQFARAHIPICAAAGAPPQVGPRWPTTGGVPASAPVPHVLLDVRDAVQHVICGLPGAVNFPYTRMRPRNMPQLRALLWGLYERLHGDAYARIHTAMEEYVTGTYSLCEADVMDVLTYCRRGVYSRLACDVLANDGKEGPTIDTNSITMEWIRNNTLPPMHVRTIKGGLLAYHEQLDQSMPLY